MLVYDLDRVLPFVQSKTPGLRRCEDMVGIGWEKDDQLLAGVLYEGFNRNNMWILVAAEPTRRWLTREYLRACFAYPFLVCGVKRLSGYVNESNEEARRFDEHLGFREEARLRGAAPDGGDVILYVMWKEWCRYV